MGFKCYLAGYITEKKIEECSYWRKQIRDYYANWKGQGKYPIEFLDPLNGKDFSTISSDGMKSNIPGKALVHRDFNAVKESNLIIANLNTFGGTRPPIGTFYELSWAWYLRKPVILITTEEMYIKHPFIIDTASVIVSTIDELLARKLINYFFKGGVNASY